MDYRCVCHLLVLLNSGPHLIKKPVQESPQQNCVNLSSFSESLPQVMLVQVNLQMTTHNVLPHRRDFWSGHLYNWEEQIMKDSQNSPLIPKGK